PTPGGCGRRWSRRRRCSRSSASGSTSRPGPSPAASSRCWPWPGPSSPLRREGRSLLLVEQYVERAVAVADYVYILGKGRIVFAGEPAECTSGAVFARYLEGAAW